MSYSSSTDEIPSKNVKISNKAWELLRRAKFELKASSYSEVILTIDRQVSRQKLEESLHQSLQSFDEERHRIKVKTPADDKKAPELPKAKTILLREDAHRVLDLIKLESNNPAYTISDAIEFLIRQSPNIGGKIPPRLS